MNAVTSYLSDFCEKFGDGWNRYWYTPVDPLPTSVLRIGVGLVAFYLVALFSFDLVQFFGPHGLLPSDAIKAIYPDVHRLTYFEGDHDAMSLRIMHYAGLAVLLAYTVGLWTRVTSILAFIVFMSYFHRAPMLTSVSEPIVAMSMVYLCFAPSGRCLSVDAWLRRRREAQSPTKQPQPDPLGGRSFAAAVSLRLIQTHLTLIYFLMFVATLQTNDVWWNGTAVWWLMARPESAMVDIRFLANYPYIINLWTTAIVVFYAAFPLLVWNRTARPLMLVSSAPFWLGIALISGLGPFCWAMFVAGLSFVSAEQWRSFCSKSTSVDDAVIPAAKGA